MSPHAQIDPADFDMGAMLDVWIRWTTFPESTALTVITVVLALAWFGRGLWYRLYLAARGEHINDRL